jgi:hypothetical protein
MTLVELWNGTIQIRYFPELYRRRLGGAVAKFIH